MTTRPQSSPAAVAVQVSMAMSRLRARTRREASDAIANEWSHAQLSALFRVTTDGPLNVSSLSRAEHVRPQSMARTVAHLQAKGVIEITPDPDDGRKHLIRSTPRAQEVIEKVVTARDEWLAQAIADVLDPDQRELLLEASELILRISALGTGLDPQIFAGDRWHTAPGDHAAADAGASQAEDRRRASRAGAADGSAAGTKP